MASDEEMQMLIDQETDPDMKAAYGEMLAGCNGHPAQRQWYAVWFMLLKNGSAIGDLCSKGLSQDGTLEIGYGVYPEFQGHGYATEAVTAMANWAAAQPGVKSIEAETEPGNAASQNVLRKAGFHPNGVIGEEGPRFVWES